MLLTMPKPSEASVIIRWEHLREQAYYFFNVSQGKCESRVKEGAQRIHLHFPISRVIRRSFQYICSSPLSCSIALLCCVLGRQTVLHSTQEYYGTLSGKPNEMLKLQQISIPSKGKY